MSLFKVSGVLVRHRFSNPDNGFGVGALLVESVEREDGPADELPDGVGPGLELAIRGPRVGFAEPGERLQLLGDLVNDRRYGLQLEVSTQASLGIQRPEDAGRWLDRLDGVGPRRRKALMAHFGDELLPVLRGEIDADLTEVDGIGPSVAKHIRDSFAELELSADLDTIQYLEGLGLSRWEQEKVLAAAKKRKTKARSLLESEPYSLTRERGLGFLRVDKIAKAAGASHLAPARLDAGVLHYLGEHVREGHTMMRLRSRKPGDGLVEVAAAELGVPDLQVYVATRRIAKGGELVIREDAAGASWAVLPRHYAAACLVYELATSQDTRADDSMDAGSTVEPTSGGETSSSPPLDSFADVLPLADDPQTAGERVLALLAPLEEDTPEEW